MSSFIKNKEKVLIELMGAQHSSEEKNKAYDRKIFKFKWFWKLKKKDCLIYENNNFKNTDKKIKKTQRK